MMKPLYSDRNIELLAYDRPNTLTVERWCKWYYLFYIDEDMKVHRLEDLWKEDAWNIDYKDNSWRPRSVIMFCKEHGIQMGLASYRAICNMWLEQAVEKELVPLDDLPTKEDFEKVVTFDDTSEIKELKEGYGAFDYAKAAGDKWLDYQLQ